MSVDNHNLIWIDLEMTGLDPKINRIIEIATLVTDSHLNILMEGPVLAIHQSDDQLALMDEWNRCTHTTSGLIKRVKQSNLDETVSAKITLDFLNQWVSAGKSPMCGNTIGQDRRFLFNYMPELESYFHYRSLDVSTLKELVIRWKPSILFDFNLRKSHNALDDIRSSVMELIYYRKYFISL